MNHLEISVDKHLGIESFDDIKNELELSNIYVRIKEHSITGNYALLDWIIPTGISLIILKPYYETFLKKAAEDHYEMLKAFLKDRLYKKAIHPDEEFKIVSMNGKEKETFFTMHFSVLHKITKDNKSITLKLMFPKDCSNIYFEKAIFSFVELQSELEDKKEADLLFDKLVKSDHGMYGSKIVWYNASKETLEFLDITQSAITKSIVPIEFV